LSPKRHVPVIAQLSPTPKIANEFKTTCFCNYESVFVDPLSILFSDFI